MFGGDLDYFQGFWYIEDSAIIKRTLDDWKGFWPLERLLVIEMDESSCN